jgi:hypothetical protein
MNSSRQFTSIIETKHWQVHRFGAQVKGAKTNSRRVSKHDPLRVVCAPFGRNSFAITDCSSSQPWRRPYIFNTLLSEYTNIFIWQRYGGFRLFSSQ